MSSPDISLITCTADQPIGISLCERFMQAQTLWNKLDIQWVVADDGLTPATLTLNQLHIIRPREPDCTPSQSLCRNLLAALPAATAPILIFIEHDDFYGPLHLSQILAGLAKSDLCGQSSRVYYNLPHACYKLVSDGAPALCQMGLRQAAKPILESVARDLDRANWWGVDAALWKRTPSSRRRELSTGSVVGIKGLPGRPGIGYGHRPKGWTPDPDRAKLRALVGNDMASEYLSVAGGPPPYRLYEYRDYAHYVSAQVHANTRKLNNVWTNEPTIKLAATYLLSRLSTPPRFGICHGTRRGNEQVWFKRHLPGCQVIGTEISPTATQFPDTIQWDFHNPNPSWPPADFVYSNSLDHAYDPRLALSTWMDSLQPAGIAIVEHSSAHGPSHVTASDPFGADLPTLLSLIKEWGYVTVDVIPVPDSSTPHTSLIVITNP